MVNASVFAWVQTSSDNRFTASAVAEIVVPQSVALTVARRIATFGECDYPTTRPLAAGESLAQGHIVRVKYASGRTRTVREWE